MKGGRNLPKKSVSVTTRVPVRRREPASPTRSADEALLNFVLGRTSGGGDDVSGGDKENEDHELGGEFRPDEGTRVTYAGGEEGSW